MTRMISQSAWCLRQPDSNPNHYRDPKVLHRLRDTGEHMNFAARVGTTERGYDLRISLGFSEVREFYRDRLMFSDDRIVAEIAFLSAKLAERYAQRLAERTARIDAADRARSADQARKGGF